MGGYSGPTQIDIETGASSPYSPGMSAVAVELDDDKFMHVQAKRVDGSPTQKWGIIVYDGRSSSAAHRSTEPWDGPFVRLPTQAEFGFDVIKAPFVWFEVFNADDSPGEQVQVEINVSISGAS